jgi:lactoylglutathione lyase
MVLFHGQIPDWPGCRPAQYERGEGNMKFEFNHNSINVLDLEKSLAFYQDALGLVETRRRDAADKSFTLVFLGDEKTAHRLELTWLRDRKEPYNLGDNEFHLALAVDDYNAAFARHKEMGCVCYENPGMGIYFIEDPDGYWIEIIPGRK